MKVDWVFILYLAILRAKAGILLSSRLLQVETFHYFSSKRIFSYAVTIWNERIYFEHLFKPKLKFTGRRGFSQEAVN